MRPRWTEPALAALRAQKPALRARTVCAADASLRAERVPETRLASLSASPPNRLRIEIDLDNSPSFVIAEGSRMFPERATGIDDNPWSVDIRSMGHG